MNSDQVSLHYVFQSVRGATPASPALKELRSTSPEVGMELRTVESAEINADRQLRDMIDVGQDVSGTVGLELSYGNADDWLEAAMCGTWLVAAKLTDTAVTATTFTVASGGTVFKKGHLVRGYNHVLSANNALFKLAADATATVVTVTGAAIETPPASAYIKTVGFEGASGDIVASVSGGRAVLTMSAASGVWTGLVTVGQWVKIGGAAAGNQFATAANNGWARVASVTATVLTFDIYPTGFGADAGAAKSIRLSVGDFLINGTTRRFATVQRRFNDHSPIDYENTKDQEASTFAFSFRPQAIATASLGLSGSTGSYTTTQLSGATNVAAPNFDIMSTADDIGMLLIDGAAVAAADDGYMTGLSFTIDNRLRDRAGLGRRGSVGKGLGRLRVSGQADFYFANLTIANKCQSNVDVGLAGMITDGTRVMLWDLPATRLAGGIQTGGADSDVMVRARLMARRHPTLAYTIAMQRYDELV